MDYEGKTLISFLVKSYPKPNSILGHVKEDNEKIYPTVVSGNNQQRKYQFTW